MIFLGLQTALQSDNCAELGSRSRRFFTPVSSLPTATDMRGARRAPLALQLPSLLGKLPSGYGSRGFLGPFDRVLRRHCSSVALCAASDQSARFIYSGSRELDFADGRKPSVTVP